MIRGEAQTPMDEETNTNVTFKPMLELAETMAYTTRMYFALEKEVRAVKGKKHITHDVLSSLGWNSHKERPIYVALAAQILQSEASGLRSVSSDGSRATHVHGAVDSEINMYNPGHDPNCRDKDCKNTTHKTGGIWKRHPDTNLAIIENTIHFIYQQISIRDVIRNLTLVTSKTMNERPKNELTSRLDTTLSTRGQLG
jgi:hypothetical protein